MSSNPLAPPSDTLSDIVSDIVDHEPKVNETIVAELTKKDTDNGADLFGGNVSENTTESSSGNNNPNVFDPTIHAVDDNGNPKRKLDGTYAKKRGRKPGQTDNGSAKPSSSGSNTVTEPKTVNYKGTAKVLCGMVFGGLEGVFGAAWKPSDGERSSIEDATETYCQSKEIGDLPPGILLLMVVGMYALPRLNDDGTKERLRKWGLMKAPPRKVENTTKVPESSKVPEPVKPTFIDPASALSQFDRK